MVTLRRTCGAGPGVLLCREQACFWAHIFIISTRIFRLVPVGAVIPLSRRGGVLSHLGFSDVLGGEGSAATVGAQVAVPLPVCTSSPTVAGNPLGPHHPCPVCCGSGAQVFGWAESVMTVDQNVPWER